MKTQIKNDSLQICQEEILFGTFGNVESIKEKESQVIETLYINEDITHDNMEDNTSSLMSMVNRVVESNMSISSNNDTVNRDIETIVTDGNILVMLYRIIQDNAYSQKVNIQLLKYSYSDNGMYSESITGLLERLLKRIYYKERNKHYHSHMQNKKHIHNKILECIIKRYDDGIYCNYTIDVSIQDMEYTDKECGCNTRNEYTDTSMYKQYHNTILECSNDNICKIVNIDTLHILQCSSIDSMLYDNDINVVMNTI